MIGLRFDDRRVVRAMDRATREALVASAREIRLTAKRGMEASARRGRMRERDLPPKLREQRRRINAMRRARGRRPLRPLRRPSMPGEPPAASRSSPLNRLLFFGWDPASRSVVVGPLGFPRSKVPHVLEYGGRSRSRRLDRMVTIESRPFMRPALAEHLTDIPRQFRGKIRSG